jgi:hypothetical protein
MANELSHSAAARADATKCTQAEFDATDLHRFNGQAVGDIPYASSATVISRLAIGSAGDLLFVSGGLPTWGHIIQAETNGITIGLAASAPEPDNNTVHIWKGSAGAVAAAPNSLLTIENASADAFINFLTANTQTQGILFGDTDDNDAGMITYDHSTSTLEFTVAAASQAKWTNGTLTFQTATTIDAGTGNSLTIKLGDAAGTNELLIKDSAGATVVRINSDGQMALFGASIDPNSALNVGGSLMGTSGSFLYNFGAWDRGAAGGDIDIYYGGLFRFRDWDSGNATRAAIDSATGNLFLGSTQPSRSTTNPTNALTLLVGTAPSGTLTDGVQLYAKDVSASAELHVMDEAGNESLLSPHDPETGEWVFWSRHTPTGRVLKVRMEALVKKLEEIFGWGFVEEYFEEYFEEV